MMEDIKTPYMWRNWKFIDWDDSMDFNLTHALHYGSWVFEWIRFYPTSSWAKIFRLKEHTDRLFYSASVLWIEIPYSKEEIIDAHIELIKNCTVDSGYIRPIVYYWSWKMWLYPKWASIETVISAWKWWKYLADKAIDVKVSKYRRMDPQTVDMEAKVSWWYYNSVLVSLETHKEWFDEWLLLSTDGNIAEWPWENIFFVKWNEVYTPAKWTILPWITRSSIIELFKDKLWIEVKEEKISPERLQDFDEAFFTWTAAEVTPIWSITYNSQKNTYKFWNNTLTKKIQDIFMNIVTGKDPDYLHWLY